MAVPLRTWWFVLAMGSFVTACAGPTPATPDAGPDESGVPVTGTPSVSAEKAQFLATFQPIVAGANDMTLAQFLALHTPANAVQPITPPADPRYTTRPHHVTPPADPRYTTHVHITSHRQLTLETLKKRQLRGADTPITETDVDSRDP